MNEQPRHLTKAELDALREQVSAGSGDGWEVTLTAIDGIPAGQYVPADDDQEGSS